MGTNAPKPALSVSASLTAVKARKGIPISSLNASISCTKQPTALLSRKQSKTRDLGMVPIIISAVSATIALISLLASLFLFMKGQKRNATMVMYRAHLDSIMIGIDHPYVLNWEPEPIEGLNKEQSKIDYQYVFFLLNTAEMSERSESSYMEEGQLLDLYAKVHKNILTNMPEEICRTFSSRVRQKLRGKLPESNW